VRASLLLFDRSPPSLILPLFFPTRHGFKDRVPEDDQMRIGEKKEKEKRRGEEEEEEEKREKKKWGREDTVMPARETGIYKLQKRHTGSLAGAARLDSSFVTRFA